jgi:DNA invertase Pin-like site-specific DNA recombinase
VDVLGYVRTRAWGPADETEPDPQEEAIRSWAEARGHRLVAIVHDELVPDSEELQRLLALAKALRMLRDGSVKAIVVSCLDRLADDPVLQERIVADVRAWGGAVFSAEAGEEDELEGEPADVLRAVVRRVLATSGDYERAKRELRINAQFARTGTPRDRQQAAMAKVEALASKGATVDEIARRLRAEGFTPDSGHLFGRARVRRLLVERSG